MKPEAWLPIAGYEGLYEVSDRGTVRSLTRDVKSRWGTAKPVRGAVLAVDCDRHGHKSVRLYKDGISKKHQIHRLVLLAFVGPCPVGCETRHLDGNEGNNRLDNLCWGTAEENWSDRYTHGTAVNVTPKHNSSGMRGVYFHKQRQKWCAYIGYQPRKTLGLFEAFEQACAARLAAETSWRGSIAEAAR